MKNLALILGLVVVLISDVGAMRPEKSDDNRDGILVTFYRVPIPRVPICIFQAQSKNIIQFGGMVSKSICVNCKEYNGVSLQSPVDIRYDMTQEELSLSLYKSFGVDPISYLLLYRNYVRRLFRGKFSFSFTIPGEIIAHYFARTCRSFLD